MTSIDTNVNNYTISELMEIIDEKTFIIDYIDQSVIKIINTDDLISHKIKINSFEGFS